MDEIELKLDEKDSLLSGSNKGSKNLFRSNKNTRFNVNEYDQSCEDHSKINKILTLKYSPIKFVFYIVFNILTFGIVNLIIIWFPTLQLDILYDEVNINKASYVGIFCYDGNFYIMPLIKKDLPDISNSNIRRMSKSNLPYGKIFLTFQFKMFNYVYCEDEKIFKPIIFTLTGKNENIHLNLCNGLNEQEYKFQLGIYGKGDLNIEIPSFLKLLFSEFSDPFYLFQVFSVILWMNNDYQAYAFVIIFATIISLFLGAYETRENLLNIEEMAKFESEVYVYRSDLNGTVNRIKVSSKDLVPGDVYELPDDGGTIPCDSILLKGNTIMNESMLIGESTPMFKIQLPIHQNEFSKSHSTSVIFFGTKIIQKRPSNKNFANKNLKIADNNNNRALVISTSFMTAKGNLIRSILYPKSVDFKFKKDSVRYIYLMAILSLLGFIIALPFLVKSGMNWVNIMKRSLDLVTTTVPPALPACIGIGITYALTRLKREKIICINSDRVNISGKVNMIVFDKTGTLTEDLLDIKGFLPTTFFEGNKVIFDNFIINCNLNSKRAFHHYKNKKLGSIHDKNGDLNQLFIECLACCHSITRVNNKLIGDPIDVKMFESTDWTFTENKNSDLIGTYVRPNQEEDLQVKLNQLGINEDEEKITNAHYELGIVRCFDFSSKLQRMSVIAKNILEKNFKVFVKGAPEKIKELCKSESLPGNFDDVLNSFTLKGNRVLALACKMVKMDYMQTQKIQREKIEKNLIFLGFLIVKNKLKENTIPTIQALSKAKLRMVMATGDNILTAISVSKECKLIPPDSTVYTCEIDDNKILVLKPLENYTDVEKYEQTFQNEEFLKKVNRELNDEEISTIKNEIDDVNDKLNTFSKHYQPETFDDADFSKNEDSDDESSKSLNSKESNEEELDLNIEIDKIPEKMVDPLNDDSVIAISGKTFEQLWKLRNKYLQTKNEKYLPHYNTFRLILQDCYIFARMNPDHKTILIQSLREEKFVVCMCGDGANDCGALKSADVGVSLSAEEASIAASFSSEIFDISCLIKLFLQGKASLVTSIQTFKYMMLYSLIQFMCVTILMILNSYLTNYQFLTSDLVIIFPLAFLISRTEAEDTLTFHIPTGALISVPIVVSILSQGALMLFFQIFSWFLLRRTKWYVNTCGCIGDIVKDCYDNTVIFLISNVQYLISAIAFSISYPFKKGIFSNYYLILWLVIGFSYSSYLIISPDQYSKYLLDLVTIPDYFFRFVLLSLAILNFITCILCEKYLVPFITKRYRQYKYDNLKKGIEGKQIEYNLNQISKIRTLAM